MTLDELPEDFTPEQFMQLDRCSLDKVPFEIAKWQCKIKLCKCYTWVRDYGMHPFYYSPRGTKNIESAITEHWINVHNQYLICHKHRKYWKAPLNNIPFKSLNGGVIWGGNFTKKPYILY